jgi:hypothetical protein
MTESEKQAMGHLEEERHEHQTKSNQDRTKIKGALKEHRRNIQRTSTGNRSIRPNMR